ncbi:MAG TPA: hypothetical protein VNH18_16440 [Bryobacteraceae bacterium]|nr:hypothetical protein [Bryobacteraceae bacterium]
MPPLRRTARKRVWLHQQAGAMLMKPSASVTVANLDKIHRPVVFVGPIVVFDASHADIYENHTARTQQGHHPPVRQSNVPVPMVGISILQYAFKVAPLLDHAGKQLRSLWIERRIESQGGFEREGRRSKMCVGRLKRPAVWETVFDGNIVPAEDLKGIQMVNDG